MLSNKLAIACAGLFSGLSLYLNAVDLAIRPDVTYQTIDGFGATYGTGAGTESDQDLLDFVAYDLGVSTIRMEMYPQTFPEPVDSPGDISYQDFDTSDRVQVSSVAEFVRNLRLRREDIRAVGSVWSPPKWMKDNNSVEGTDSGFLLNGADPDNRLSDDKYDHFARWLIEYTKLLEDRGSPLYALSLQNELMFTQWFQSCMYTSDEYAKVVRTVGAAFQAEGVARPLFFGPEDMTVAHYYGTDNRHRPYVDALMEDGTRQYFDAFATHGYVDGVQSGGAQDPSQYWDGIKGFGLPYWITEGGTGSHNWPTPITTGIGAYMHHALIGGNASMFLAWSLLTPTAPDEHNVLPVKPMSPSKKTYTAMHYWRYIRPGFVRIEAQASGTGSSDLRVSAFRDADKKRFVIVAINTHSSSSRTLDLNIESGINPETLDVFQTTSSYSFSHRGTVSLSNGEGSLTLPARSITTLVSLNPVTGITLSHDDLEVPVGYRKSLDKIIMPLDASDPKVSWESANPAVATVNGGGEVTGVEEGETTITATTRDGAFSASATVRVSFSRWSEWNVLEDGWVDTGDAFLGWIHARKNLDWIWLSGTRSWAYLPQHMVSPHFTWMHLQLNPEDEEPTSLQAAPSVLSLASAPYTAMSTATSNVALGKPVSVSAEEGTGYKENLVDGSAETAWAAQGYPHWAIIDLQGFYDISEFRVFPNYGRAYQYRIAVSENGVDYSEIVNRASNNQQASVFSHPVEVVARYVRLTVVGPASHAWSNISELEVMGVLQEVPVENVTVSHDKIYRGVGQTFPLQVTVYPAEAFNKEVSWSSDNSSVATVDDSGVITAVGEGVATITATSLQNSVSAQAVVVVGPSLMWGLWPIAENGIVDTGDFIGSIQVYEGTNWVFLHDFGNWAYLPETFLRSDGAWAGVLRN